MSPKTPKTLLIVSLLIVASLVLSACNNPAAKAPASIWPWTWGDRTIEQTRADAAKVCDAFGLEVTALDPNTGDPQCGTVSFSDQTSAPADDGDQRTVGPQGGENRVERIMRLDKVFRSSGAAAWLEAAGLVYDWAPGYFDARQPEEETLAMPDGSAKIVVSGFQVDAVRGLYVGYPACVTTDTPSRIVQQNSTRKHLVDPSNGSTIYTNVSISGDGQVTVWVDCSNWSQIADLTVP